MAVSGSHMPEQTKLLIILATYNEAGNIKVVYSLLRQTVPHADILFVDDNSPDGTGEMIDQIIEDDSRVHVIHRPSKMGVGGAHRDGLSWAYENNYTTAMTMDCDLLHSPEYVPEFLAVDPDATIVVGSRFLVANSLHGWELHRRLLTHTGRVLAKYCLGMDYDSTGSFRRYDLTTIPRRYLDLVETNGYSFFFESLHVLHMNGFRIDQVPVILLARTKGKSKMTLRDVFIGFRVLLRQIYKMRFQKERLLLNSDTI